MADAKMEVENGKKRKEKEKKKQRLKEKKGETCFLTRCCGIMLHFPCISQGFLGQCLYFSRVLGQCDFCVSHSLYFPAFQRFSPEIVSKKARSLGSESLKHYKNWHSRKHSIFITTSWVLEP